MTRQRIMWTGAAIATTGLLMALSIEVYWVRILCAAAFCLVAPGYGWARRMNLKDRGDTLALAAVFSLCATVVVGTVMAVTGWWSPLAGFAVLLLVSVSGFVRFRRATVDQHHGAPHPGIISLEVEKVSRWRVDFPARAPEPKHAKGVE